MIFKESILKKLIQEAYKTDGLHIARCMDDYILSGAYWAIRIHKDIMTNKAKGNIVELIGSLPEEGESWKVDKDSMQIEMETVIDPEDYIKEVMTVYAVTNVMQAQSSKIARVLRNMDTNEHIFLNNVFVEMITWENLNEEMAEAVPEGPYGVGKAVIWKNNYSTLVCYQRKGEDGDTLLDVLTAAARKEDTDEGNNM